MKHITIKELAAHLYLSASTVSKALNDSKEVSLSTKEKVKYAAEQLGYKIEVPKIDLQTETKTIGFIVPKITTPFFAKVMRSASKILYPLGYKLIILESNNNLERERENLLQLEALNVDGIIINIYHEYNLYICQGLVKRGTPVILFGKKPSNGSETYFTIVNDYITASQAFENLMNNGRVACIMGSKERRKTCEHARGYDKILNKYKMHDSSLIIETNEDYYEAGVSAMKQLREGNIKFDSIYVLNHNIASAVVSYLKKENIKTPEEIIVMDYLGRRHINILSSISDFAPQSPSLIGETAGLIILDKIKDNLDPENRISFYPGFIDIRPIKNAPKYLCAGLEYLYFSEERKKEREKTQVNFLFD